MNSIMIGTKVDLVDEIANQFKKQIKSKPSSALCLPTGNSPIEIYKKLIEFYKKDNLSFKGIETYNLDEYLGIDPWTNPLSFRKFMDTYLFDHIDIKKTNTHFPKSIRSYNDLLDDVEQFDLAMIGVGVNGHIAFNEPGSEFGRTQEVELSSSTIKVNFLEKGIDDDYPDKAITMGLFDIYEKSNKIILIAWGESKRAALIKFKEAKASGIKDPSWPITYFIDHPNFKIYTDIKI